MTTLGWVGLAEARVDSEVTLLGGLGIFGCVHNVVVTQISPFPQKGLEESCRGQAWTSNHFSRAGLCVGLLWLWFGFHFSFKEA